MDFTKSDGNKVHKLIKDGENVKVNKDNLEEYLRLNADYECYKKFKEILDSFKEGFCSVVDLLVFKKWIRPHEISLFT